MATRILNSKSDYISPCYRNEYGGYCLENPFEVIKALSRIHWISRYKGYRYPFDSYSGGTSQRGGLHIEEINNEISPPVGTKIIFSLEELVKTSVLDIDKRKKKISEHDLKEAFLERVKKFHNSESPYTDATNWSYWKGLDFSLIREIESGLFHAGVYYSKITPVFNKCRVRLDGMNGSIEPILIELRKEFPEFTPEIEKVAYDKVAEDYKFSIPIDLLRLFDINNAIYQDLKNMIKPKKIRK